MTDRDPFASYRERLAALGFAPRRRLGQNFLLQPELHRVIAETAQVGAADLALEIGAGLGFLTRELARRASHVVAVEVDPRLCTILREDLASLPERDRVELVEADALGPGTTLAPSVLRALDRHLDPPLKVAANLPYVVAGPLLAALCTTSRLPAAMALLLQRELAERLAAEPATPEYGSLSVLVQASYRVRVVRRVGPDVFRPRPLVESAVVELAGRGPPGPGWGAAERVSFGAFVRALFSARRKKARHGLEAAVRAAGGALPATVPFWVQGHLDRRPGELEVAVLLDLWRWAQGRS